MTQTLRDFDAVAANWDDNPVRRELNNAIAGAVRDRVTLRPGMSAMDLGCGTGQLTVALAGHVAHVLAVDTSAAMLEVLDRKLREAGVGNVRTLQVDLTCTADLGQEFDLIVSSMALHHISEPAALVVRLAGLLSPGGRLCIADLDEEDGSFHPDATGVFHPGFPEGQTRAMFAGAGLVAVTCAQAHAIQRPKADGTMGAYPVLLTVGTKA